ncbi:ABC transporter, ATP-binding protein [Syntrophotalea carbinolica DSM 2380]|uniref:ABC transporter, ATP-binding protein n=1 Tax=Syntrophotalea carbinolica (strain DSM 2380 / NBRC 103641 / GraBd1) TaxID=338963 RepID=Q3A488_SYNC1|nr:ATP-binding cassette domain-containing protein [Syntrophotalea carbinolica]ABA88819.1 ABC transporter, ATP-binding protein [Syntrophotalea carbinolica DSM 2380]
MKSTIKVKGLTRKFGDLVAVNRVEFDVYQGEIFGFLGPNGAGKTTTVRMLTGVIDPTEGTATIQGHDIRKEGVLSRAHIAVVPEEANVYRDLSVWENIMLMAELHGVARHQRFREAARLLDELGLTERKKQKACELSKGLRQRVMLCAALVTNPDILFLDEPTSGLDVQSAGLIRRVVSDLNRKGLTVFLTTHNMSEASEMCTRVAIIDKGNIVAIDTPERLRSAMSSRQFVEVRFGGIMPGYEELESLPGVSQIDANNGVFRLYTESPGHVLTEVIRLADRRGLEIRDLCNRKPSLEDVFLHFTGGQKENPVQ